MITTWWYRIYVICVSAYVEKVYWIFLFFRFWPHHSQILIFFFFAYHYESRECWFEFFFFFVHHDSCCCRYIHNVCVACFFFFLSLSRFSFVIGRPNFFSLSDICFFSLDRKKIDYYYWQKCNNDDTLFLLACWLERLMTNFFFVRSFATFALINIDWWMNSNESSMYHYHRDLIIEKFDKTHTHTHPFASMSIMMKIFFVFILSARSITTTNVRCYLLGIIIISCLRIILIWIQWMNGC